MAGSVPGGWSRVRAAGPPGATAGPAGPPRSRDTQAGPWARLGAVEELGPLRVELLGDRAGQGGQLGQRGVAVDDGAGVPAGPLDDVRVGRPARAGRRGRGGG